MASYVTLKNANLPDAQTITVIVQDGQTISAEYVRAGWSVVSTTTDPQSAGQNFGYGDFVTLWKPNTAYGASARVLLPNGAVGTPVAAFTSGAAFDATKWTVVNDVGSGGGAGVDAVARAAAAAAVPAPPLLVAITPASPTTALTKDAAQPANATDGPILLGAMPTLAGAGVGDTWTLEKSDQSTNTVTVPFAAGDTTAGGSTQLQLSMPGTVSLRVVANPAGGRWWKVINHVRSDGSLAERFRFGRPFVDAPVGWRKTFDDAAAAACAPGSTSPCGIMNLTDSVGGSDNNPDKLNTGRFALHRANFLSRPGATLHGDYFSAWPLVVGAGLTTQYGPFGTPASAAASYEVGIGRAVGPGTALNNDWITYTPRGNRERLELVFLDLNAGTWKVSGLPAGAVVTVPGGGATVAVANGVATITNAGTGDGATTGYGTATLRKLRIAGLGGTAPTLTIGQQSAAHVLMLSGVAEYTGNPGGFFFAWIGHSGADITDYTTTRGAINGVGGLPSAPNSKIDLFAGKLSAKNTAGSNISPVPFGFPFGCHLVFLSFGINGSAAGVSTGSFARAYRRAYQALRAAMKGASIVDTAYSVPDSQVSDVTITGRGWLYQAYKAVKRSLAHTYVAAYVDIDAAWGESGNADGLQDANNLHPKAAGDAATFAIERQLF